LPPEQLRTEQGTEPSANGVTYCDPVADWPRLSLGVLRQNSSRTTSTHAGTSFFWAVDDCAHRLK
jgi:hypothetical protein